VVRRVVLAAGDRLAPLPEDEPHTAWRQVDKPAPGEPPRRPIRHQPGKSTWRGMAALLATRTETAEKVTTTVLQQQLADLQALGHVPVDLPLQVLTVGVLYGNQSAVVEDVMVDAMPLPIAALSPESPVRQLLLDVADQADRLREAANRLGDDLRLAAGGDKLPWDRSLRLGEAVVNEFTPVVRRMLAGLQRQPERVDDAEQAWKIVARRLAWHPAPRDHAPTGPGLHPAVR
jgi:CRISPR system Cascade subunit CasA